MASNCQYEQQLAEACRLVAERAGHPRWKLVYQSRSGSPTVPWLEPDVCDYIKQLHEDDSVHDLGHFADRIHLRPHGSAVRSRYRSQRDL